VREDFRAAYDVDHDRVVAVLAGVERVEDEAGRDVEPAHPPD
jgi:hypothetical protein